MSEEHVKAVIVRAVMDREFRQLLFSDPDKALVGLVLTDEEIQKLKSMEREAFDLNASELEDRMSRAGFGLPSFSPTGWDPDDIGWDPDDISWDPGDIGKFSLRK